MIGSMIAVPFICKKLGPEKLICGMVERMDMPHVVDQLRKLEEYGLQNEEKYPWMPSAWNRNHC